MRVAVATYFASAGLRARIRDPDEFDRDAVDIELSEEDLARLYYAPVLDVVTALPVDQPSQDYVRTPLPGMDATLLVSAAIVSWYRDRRPSWTSIVEGSRLARPVMPELLKLKQMSESERARILREPTQWFSLDVTRLHETSTIGLDGIGVELGASWSVDYMRREPEDRAG
jgi:hypothetical protein